MAIFHESLLFAAAYVAGCLTGHRVVTVLTAFVKAEAAKLHVKLDALTAKSANTSHPLRK